MAESRARLGALPDEALEAALRDLAAAVAFPSAAPAGAPDIATRVRVRIADAPPTARRPWLGRARPMRRGLVLALAALLIVAAVAGAVGLGVPGIRIIFGEGTPPATTGSPSVGGPSGSLAPVGSTLGLGTIVTLDEAERIAGFDALLPTSPNLGPPDGVFLAHERLALVWAASPDLPEAGTDGVGLLINEFRGDVDDGYFQKILHEDAVLTRVTVGGSPGWWISGPPHFFMYVDPSGDPVDDSHRVVGNTLIWTSGELTFRLESALTMDEAIRLAESLR